VGCDFLVVSAYKFFGPHLGILYGRHEILDRLRAYKVRPAPDSPPGKFETGTQLHENIVGTLGALEYLAGLVGGDARGGLRSSLDESMHQIEAYESQATDGSTSTEGDRGERLQCPAEPSSLATDAVQGSRRFVPGLYQNRDFSAGRHAS